jgi:hypothetical protein
MELNVAQIVAVNLNISFSKLVKDGDSDVVRELSEQIASISETIPEVLEQMLDDKAVIIETQIE